MENSNAISVVGKPAKMMQAFLLPKRPAMVEWGLTQSASNRVRRE
jgi:hypothetical protein